MIGLRAVRQSVLAAALTLACAVPVTAQSLADTMVSAYRHSALMEQNRAVLRAADEGVASAVAALRPVLQWAAGHSISRAEGADGSTRSSSLTLGVNMTLFDWGRSQLAIDAAKEQVLATRQALVGIEQDVLLAATVAFFDVQSALEQVALQENSVLVLEQERRAAQDRFEVGEITVTDVAQADAQLAATRAALVAAQGDLEIARENYLAATGQRPGNLTAPPPLPQLPANLETARAVAQRNHPAIQQAQRSAAAAELGIAAARAEQRPSLTGSLGVDAQRGLSAQTRDYDTRTGASASLNLSQTIYSGGRISSGIRRAMANRDQARAVLLNTARQISQQVGTAWTNIDVTRAQIRAISEQIIAAQQAYEGVREEATLGARTTLDVLDAEQALLEARADLITAESNLQLAHYQLLAAMGLLTVENLNLGIPTYDPSQYYNAVRNAPAGSPQGDNLDRVLRAIGRD